MKRHSSQISKQQSFEFDKPESTKPSLAAISENIYSIEHLQDQLNKRQINLSEFESFLTAYKLFLVALKLDLEGICQSQG